VTAFTDSEKLKWLQREIAMRKNVYPKWVANGRLKPDKADREIALMEAIAEDYRLRIVTWA
jgi:hypothetical protein